MNFNHFLTTALVIGTLHASLAFSQASDTPSNATKPAERLDEIVLLPGEHGYTLALAKAGVQGTVTVMAILDEKGKLGQATIKESSSSRELDSAALAIVPRLAYRVPASAPTATAVLLPVVFRKDSTTNINKKTCADFNTDLAYWNASFPGQSKSMPVLDLTLGILALSGKYGGPLAIGKKSSAIIQEAIANCAKEPDRLFMEAATATLSAGK